MSVAAPSRRLQTLSDIVFALAMTSLASRLPVPTGAPPTWHDLVALERTPLLGLFLSFTIATLFWSSHHRRMALFPPSGLRETVLSFAFLLAVMLLPTTTDLYSRFAGAGDTLSIYCSHLGLLFLLHVLLWVLTILRAQLSWRLVLAPLYGLATLSGAAVAAIRYPGLGQILLYATFLVPAVGRFAARGVIHETN